MEKKLLWFFVVALVIVDVVLLVDRRQGQDRLQSIYEEAGAAMLEAQYADEEQLLLTRARRMPAGFPAIDLTRATGRADELEFFLLASIHDCTNCIEDEISKLNEIAVRGARGEFGLGGVTGFFVDEDRPEIAERFIAHLSPTPAFPVTVENALVGLEPATTPLVLVVRARDKRILDAHKPIPENLAKRDAFYARWGAALEGARSPLTGLVREQR